MAQVLQEVALLRLDVTLSSLLLVEITQWYGAGRNMAVQNRHAIRIIRARPYGRRNAGVAVVVLECAIVPSKMDDVQDDSTLTMVCRLGLTIDSSIAKVSLPLLPFFLPKPPDRLNGEEKMWVGSTNDSPTNAETSAKIR